MAKEWPDEYASAAIFAVFGFYRDDMYLLERFNSYTRHWFFLVVLRGIISPFPFQLESSPMYYEGGQIGYLSR